MAVFVIKNHDYAYQCNKELNFNYSSVTRAIVDNDKVLCLFKSQNNLNDTFMYLFSYQKKKIYNISHNDNGPEKNILSIFLKLSLKIPNVNI